MLINIWIMVSIRLILFAFVSDANLQMEDLVVVLGSFHI